MTYQQARGNRDDVVYRVFSGYLPGVGDVSEDAAMDYSSKDEVNVADQDEH